jgi:hypothetical protein
MKRTMIAVALCATAGLALSQVAIGQQAPSSASAAAKFDQQVMQQGPTTDRPGYLVRKDPVAPKHAAAPTDPRLLRPLTQREIGMLYNACVSYPECAIAYSRAYEHNQALLRARKAEGEGGH